MVSVSLVVPTCINWIIHPIPNMFWCLTTISKYPQDVVIFLEFRWDFSHTLGAANTLALVPQVRLVEQGGLSLTQGGHWRWTNGGMTGMVMDWILIDYHLDYHLNYHRLSSRLLWSYYYHHMIWKTWNGNHQADPEMLLSFGLVLYLTMRDPEMSSEDQNQFPTNIFESGVSTFLRGYCIFLHCLITYYIVVLWAMQISVRVTPLLVSSVESGSCEGPKPHPSDFWAKNI